jgi:hypothetical protein
MPYVFWNDSASASVNRDNLNFAFTMHNACDACNAAVLLLGLIAQPEP